MPTTRSDEKTAAKEELAAEALAQLQEALRAAGILLPSLRLDLASPKLGLVVLGAVNAETARLLALAVREGSRATRP
ncbi:MULTISPECIES: hypothetical protein [Streptomyces]|uniref:hypothetical protein n=1 Tax=Streptomyces TaxID=1883 RepID=UPI001FD83F4E|nr:hypothetical protein [Streptomyces sp. KCTC 0041BP]